MEHNNYASKLKPKLIVVKAILERGRLSDLTKKIGQIEQLRERRQVSWTYSACQNNRNWENKENSKTRRQPAQIPSWGCFFCLKADLCSGGFLSIFQLIFLLLPSLCLLDWRSTIGCDPHKGRIFSITISRCCQYITWVYNWNKLIDKVSSIWKKASSLLRWADSHQ